LKNYDKISFVIGADNLLTLNKWKNIDELKKLIDFLVVSRDNKKSNEFKTINLNINISSTEIRKNPENYKNYLPEIVADEIINFYKGNKK